MGETFRPTSGLANYDANWCVRRLPKQLVKLMEGSSKPIVIAGGYIRSCIASEPVNDIDVFSVSPEASQLNAIKLSEDRLSIVKTPNAWTVKLPNSVPVQFIHRWSYEKVEELLPSFDFTIARAALWAEKKGAVTAWHSMVDPRFYEDLAAKRLVYCKPERNEDAGGSILRVLKFYQRGYRIPLDSLGSVIARLVSGVDFAKVPHGDFEQELGRVLTGLLYEVDPSIDPNHLAHVPAVGEPVAQEAASGDVQ